MGVTLDVLLVEVGIAIWSFPAVSDSVGREDISELARFLRAEAAPWWSMAKMIRHSVRSSQDTPRGSMVDALSPQVDLGVT